MSKGGRRLNWFAAAQVRAYQETGSMLMLPEHLRVFGFWRGMWIWLRYDVGGSALVLAGFVGILWGLSWLSSNS